MPPVDDCESTTYGRSVTVGRDNAKLLDNYFIISIPLLILSHFLSSFTLLSRFFLPDREEVNRKERILDDKTRSIAIRSNRTGGDRFNALHVHLLGSLHIFSIYYFTNKSDSALTSHFI